MLPQPDSYVLGVQLRICMLRMEYNSALQAVCTQQQHLVVDWR